MAQLNHSKDPIILQATIGRKTVRALHRSGKIHWNTGHGFKASKLRAELMAATVNEVAEAWRRMFHDGYSEFKYNAERTAVEEIKHPVKIEILDDLQGALICEAK